MQVTTCRVGSDRLRMSIEKGVLEVIAGGLLGPAECRGALMRMGAAAREAGAVAVLLDLRGAALALSTPQYVELFNLAASDPLRRRVALVVGPGLMPAARAHQTLMSRRGLDHRPFSSAVGGRRWLARSRPPQATAGLFEGWPREPQRLVESARVLPPATR